MFWEKKIGKTFLERKVFLGIVFIGKKKSGNYFFGKTK